MNAFARLIATWFYLGLTPKGPGTAGSIGALAIAWALHAWTGIGAVGFGLMALIGLAPAIWASGVTAKVSGLKDPQIVVVDEVIGQWATLAGAVRFNWKAWLGALLLFRLFDIFKPPPVRQLERLPGGAGIVLDDAMAGVYAALVLFAAGWFNLY
jgi:phosphatidylglycerophosphatase A